MNAVVLKVKGNHAAVLCDDGNVMRVADRGYEIGQRINVHKTAPIKYPKLVGAAAVFAVLIGLGSWSFFSPYTYVSLDVNPSIEYSVNRFQLVISAKGVNEDGTQILENLNLRFLSIEDAVTKTVEEIDEQGYFQPSDPACLILSASCKQNEKSTELLQILEKNTVSQIETSGYVADVQGTVVSYEDVQSAKALGTTPGKLKLIEELQNSASDPDSIVIEEWIDQSVKDIMKEIHANNKNKSDVTGSDDEPDTSLDEESDGSLQNDAETQITEDKKNADNGNSENVKDKSEKTNNGNTKDKTKDDNESTEQ